MKINETILSLPPYLSTAWRNVISLQVEGHPSGLLLIVELISGSRIGVPNLSRPTIEAIFAAHAQYTETVKKTPFDPSGGLPIAISLPQSLPNLPSMPGLEGGFASILQHNMEQASSPDISPEILKQIASVSKMMGLDALPEMPKAEPHCNCPHCQVMRAMHGGSAESEILEEEIVSDDDLKFRTWNIDQRGGKLYVVSNPNDSNEQYNVFLGEPLGCTCGQKNCEHIQAVLKS